MRRDRVLNNCVPSRGRFTLISSAGLRLQLDHANLVAASS
jgi:hypothetical protein